MPCEPSDQLCFVEGSRGHCGRSKTTASRMRGPADRPVEKPGVRALRSLGHGKLSFMVQVCVGGAHLAVSFQARCRAVPLAVLGRTLSRYLIRRGF